MPRCVDQRCGEWKTGAAASRKSRRRIGNSPVWSIWSRAAARAGESVGGGETRCQCGSDHGWRGAAANGGIRGGGCHRNQTDVRSRPRPARAGPARSYACGKWRLSPRHGRSRAAAQSARCRGTVDPCRGIENSCRWGSCSMPIHRPRVGVCRPSRRLPLRLVLITPPCQGNQQ